MLRRLAVLLAALAVCATVASVWGAWVASAAVDVAASAGASGSSERVRLLGADHDAPQPELAFAIFEDELGEDDDACPGVTDAAARPIAPLADPRAASRGWPADPSSARSRLAAGAASARGPPALQA